MNKIIQLKPKTRPCPLCKKLCKAEYNSYSNGTDSWSTDWHLCVHEGNKDKRKLKLLEKKENG